jgi:hypothetical protein
MVIVLLAIGGYSINGLLVDILLVDSNGYYISGYWWIFY